MEAELPSEENDSEIEYPTTMDPDFDPSEVGIESEVKEKRSATSKTFRKIDGTYEVAMYKDIVHYKENGTWKQINNRLIDDGTSLENKENKFKLKFPKELDDNKQIKLTMDKYSIDWSVLNIESSIITYDDSEITPNNIKELPYINQSILYSNIQDNVDIEYIITGSQVKENIILNQYVQDFSMTFEYKLKDLSLVEQEDGRIAFVNSNGEIIFFFNDFVMYDKDFNESFDITYELLELGNKEYQITITPNDTWLQHANYPVEIDPSIQVNGTTGITEDKTITEPVSSKSIAATTLQVGFTNGIEHRSYLALNLNLIGDLSSRSITYAYLGLFKTTSNAYNDLTNNIQLREVYDSISFNDIDSIDNYITSNKIIDYRVISDDYNVYQYFWDLTKNIKTWKEESNLTRVVELRSISEGAISEFYSTDFTQYEFAQPIITIGFIDTNGIKDYWTYQSYDVEEAGMGVVSDYSGKLTFTRDDLSFSTLKQSLNLSMIYSVDDANSNIGYGKGWKTNYNVVLKKDTRDNWYLQDATNNKVFYSMEVACDSRVQSDSDFYYNTCYLSEDGSRNILVIGKAYYGGIVYKHIITPDYLKMRFGADEHLDSITDTRYDPVITIGRNSSNKDLITKITDSSGNEIALQYESDILQNATLTTKSGTETHILEEVNYSINDETLGSVNYKKNYNESTSLTQDYTIYYMYDSENRLDGADSPSGLCVEFDYLSLTDNRVEMVTSYNHNEEDNVTKNIGQITYEYGDFYTKISDQNTDFLIKNFDTYGHTISVLDNTGVASHTTYRNPLTQNIGNSLQPNYVIVSSAIPNYYLNHKMISKSPPQNTQTNPIYNHSFEVSDFDNDESWKKDSAISTTYDPSYVNDKSVSGDQSLRVYSLNSSKEWVYQTIHLQEQRTYTLKGFVYNDLQGSSYLELEYGGTTVQSNKITTQKEWKEIELTFNLPENTSYVKIKLVKEGEGDVYFDNLQIKDGYNDTRTNLVDNSSFESESIFLSGAWTRNNLNDISVIDYTTTSIPINEYYHYDFLFGNSAIQFNNTDGIDYLQASYGLNDIDYTQYSSRSGKLTVGSWSFVDYSSSTSVSPYTLENESVYGIRVDFMNAKIEVGDTQYSEHLKDTAFINFNSNVEDSFQYILEEINVPSGTQYINISYVYSAAGLVYFDNLQVYQKTIFSHNSYHESTGQLTGLVGTSGSSKKYSYNDFSNHPSSAVIYGADGTIQTSVSNEEDAAYLVNDIKVNNVSATSTKNSDGMLTSMKIGEGENYYISYYNYYSSDGNFVERIVNPYGSRVWNYYNELTGLLDQVKNENLNTMNYCYDSAGNVTNVVHKENEPDDPTINCDYVLYEYNDNNQLAKINLDNDFYYQLTYDSLGRIENVSVNSDSLMSYEYITKNGYETSMLNVQTYANGDSLKFEYNDKDQVISVLSKEDQDVEYHKEFGYEYDHKNRVSVYKTFNSIGDVIHFKMYEYDESNNLIRITDENNNYIHYTYDDLNNLNNISYDINDSTHSVFYDHYQMKSLNRDEIDESIFHETIFDYTNTNVLLGIEEVAETPGYISFDSGITQVETLEDGASVFFGGMILVKDSESYTVELNVNSISVTDSSESVYWKVTEYQYSSDGKLEYTKVVDLETALSNGSFTTSYVPSDGVVAIRISLYSASTFTIEFDNMTMDYDPEEMIQMYDKTEYSTQDSYNVIKNYISNTDPLQRLSETNLTNGSFNLNASYGYYLNTDRVTNIEYSFGNGLGSFSFSYTYDDIGNINSINETYGSTTVVAKYFDYDSMNQLITEEIDDGSNCQTATSTCFSKYYKYDEKGNITEVKTYSYGETKIIEQTIPEFYENSYGTSDCYMKYNSTYKYNDIYMLDVGEVPSMTFQYKDSLTDSSIIGMNTSKISGNLDYNSPGYYYEYYEATSFFTECKIDFKIVYKVGDDVQNIPDNHVKYIYDSTWKDQLSQTVKVIYDQNGNSYEQSLEKYSYDEQGNPTRIDVKTNNGMYDYAVFDYQGRQLTKTHTGIYPISNNYLNENSFESSINEIRVDNIPVKPGETYTFYMPDSSMFGEIQIEIKGQQQTYVNESTNMKDLCIEGLSRLICPVFLDSNETNISITIRAQDIDSYLSMMGLYEIQLNEGQTMLPHDDYQSGGDTQTISYTYNDQGYRTSKTINGNTITYHLHEDKVVYETDDTYGIIYTYDIDGTLISFNYDNDINDTINGTEYYYVHNLQGDIVKILDKNGSIVVEYTYDAWGNHIEISGTLSSTIGKFNPYRYRGYRYDEELSFYYLNSRYYNPNTGRFINADGLLGKQGNILGHNMYAYTQNNPVMYSDISGYAPEFLEDYWEWVVNGYEAIGRTEYGQWVKDGYRAIGKELSQEFMVDLSYSGKKYKFGISVIVNLEDEYFEFYPHFGRTWGTTQGPSVSFGVVENYHGPGEYAGVFAYAEGGYYIGGGHCLSPFDANNGAKAYYIEIANPGASVGVDYYFWDDWMVFDWSGE